jgi:hypothetical protein
MLPAASGTKYLISRTENLQQSLAKDAPTLSFLRQK